MGKKLVVILYLVATLGTQIEIRDNKEFYSEMHAETAKVDCNKSLTEKIVIDGGYEPDSGSFYFHFQYERRLVESDSSSSDSNQEPDLSDELLRTKKDCFQKLKFQRWINSLRKIIKFLMKLYYWTRKASKYFKTRK
jgi:hypothetical protein